MGLALGLGIGLLVSLLYIPFMQFVSSLEGTVPPYMVTMAWTEIAQIVALFVATFVLDHADPAGDPAAHAHLPGREAGRDDLSVGCSPGAPIRY